MGSEIFKKTKKIIWLFLQPARDAVPVRREEDDGGVVRTEEGEGGPLAGTDRSSGQKSIEHMAKF